MRGPARVGVVLVLAALAAYVVVLREGKRAARDTRRGAGEGAPADESVALPTLLEIGGKECLPCKQMEPVLAALRRHYRGQLRVQTLDFWEDEDVADRYRAMRIPTQVFLSPSGEELGRHEGPISEQGIVARWRELGYELTRADAPSGEEDTARPPLLVGLFETAGRFLRGAPAVALAAAFVWGILSVVLSPCHLASIPLIVGFIDAQGRTTARRACLTSALFAAGLLVTFGVVGALTAAAGRVLGSVGAWANYPIAVLFLLVALVLLDVLPMPWSGPGQVGMTRRGLVAALVLGLVFGLAIGPCTFVYLAPILGVAFKVGETALAFGIVLLAAYGLGHASVIVAAGTSTGLVQRYLNWHERSRGAVWLKRACGALVAMAGLYLLYTAP